jgi:3-methyladenine DNA glycosylase AlkC
MAEPLKLFFSAALIRRLAVDVERVHPGFATRAFIKTATEGLEQLELLERARHIARAFEVFLPPSYPAAIDILVRSLGPEHVSDELAGAGMAPFIYLPHVVFVAQCGLEHFDESMHAQYELTKRFSAEFSIRPFIARDPERTMAVLRGWATDNNPHVRRLVSEGTRLRLPWAIRVPWLDAHPERILELLEMLKDDHTSVVRRSVANSLNDLGRVRPDLLVRTCRSWLTDASPQRRALIEHALRSAVKRGHADALHLLGYGKKASVKIERVLIAPARVAIGGRVAIDIGLHSTARTTQELLVDIAVHFIKASGKTSPKVFKLTRTTLAARGRVQLHTSVSLAVHTTRKPRPGRHHVDVIINGMSQRIGSFQVTAAHAAKSSRK